MIEQLGHKLWAADGGGLRCEVCEHRWKTTPVNQCPGVPWYEWESAPEGLLTKTQAHGQGLRLKKGAVPSGCIWYAKKQSWIWLYALDQTEERPAPTEKQVAAAQKAREKQQALRTCKKCGREMDSRRDLEAGVCAVCWHIDFLETVRQGAVDWARALLLAPDNWVILDTETTGLDYGSEIVQIAILDPASGEGYQTLVRPEKAIPAEATAVHGITDEMVADAPIWPEIWQRVAKLVSDKIVVTYNAAFDRNMLAWAERQYEFKLQPRDWQCAMEWYAQWYGEWSEYHRSFRWQRLPGGDHSALGDCRATLELIQRMAAVQESEESDG